MSNRIAPPLVQTCEILTTSLSGYGRQQEVSSAEVSCRFRWITELNDLGGREEVRGDAMLWLDHNASVDVGTIIRFDSELFRVERYTEARRLDESRVHFYKCVLRKHAGINNA